MDSIFSPRLLYILKVLAQSEDYVTTRVLAEAVGVSTRTIFRELDNINTFLETYGISVESKTGLGYKMHGDKENMHRFLANIESIKNPLTYTNPDSRKELLILQCLKDRELTKLSTLAYLFDVSEGTISRDLEAIEPWFESYKLKLIRRQGYGVSVEGDEEHIRKAITDYIHKRIELENLSNLESYNIDVHRYFDQQEEGILGLLNRDILLKVIDVLEQSTVNIAKKITQHSYIGLIIHLAIAVERVQNHDLIEMDVDTLNEMKDHPIYKESYIIATDIEDRFKIRFPEAEVGYIFMHLQGTRPQNLNHDPEEFKDNYEALMITNRLIERFSNILKEDFTQDSSLRTGLMAHLKPTLNRLKYNLEIRNPLLEEIMNQYEELFEIVKETSRILYIEYQCKLSNDEVGYLTLHFGAAIERKKHLRINRKNLRIGVVCASGIGISTLLASKLKNAFLDIDEIEPYAIADTQGDAMASVDLIVSTLVIETSKPIVYVNPLLKNEDILKVRQAIDSLSIHDKPRIVENQQKHYNMNILDEIGLTAISFESDVKKTVSTLIDALVYGKIYKDKILDAVLKRECNGSIVIDEHQFVMYHASVAGIDVPEVLFFKHLGKKKHRDFKNIEIGVLMVIPNPAKNVDRKTMSKITESMIDEPKVLESVHNFDKKTLIEAIIDYL